MDLQIRTILAEIAAKTDSEAAIEKLYSFCKSSEIRDFENFGDVVTCVLNGIDICMGMDLFSLQQDGLSRERNLWEIWVLLTQFPEFNVVEILKTPTLTINFCSQVLHRLVNLSIHEEESLLTVCAAIVSCHKCFLLWVYKHCIPFRESLRLMFGKALLHHSGIKNARRDVGRGLMHVQPLLQILLAVINGMKAPLCDCSRDLLLKVLMKLHEPNEYVVWRDQIPAIQSYHTMLSKCVLALIEKDHSHATSGCLSNDSSESINGDDETKSVSRDDEKESSVDSSSNGSSFLSTLPHSPWECSNSCLVLAIRHLLLYCWPAAHNANAPKEVLLLHELEQIMETARPDEFAEVEDLFVNRLRLSSGDDTEYVRIIQRTLQIFRNKSIMSLFERDESHMEKLMTALVPTLYRKGEVSWNPTVNKFTATVLRKFQDIDPELFARACEIAVSRTNAARLHNSCGTGSKSSPPHGTSGLMQENKRFCGEGKADAKENTNSLESKLDGDRKESEEKLEMKPPDPRRPPVVARPIAAALPIPTLPTISVHSNVRMMPPLIRPPALATSGPPHVDISKYRTNVVQATGPPSNLWRPGLSGGPPPLTVTGVAPWAHLSNAGPPPSLPAITERDDESSARFSPGFSASALQQVMAYVAVCSPEEGELIDAISSWSQLQSAPTPTLLPSLKFHDLVFGQELGRGAFSVVKYARQITAGKTRSDWPEYAVKTISASKIAEARYERNVEREMAILQILCHPGVARLVSTFRYTDSAYLVLEYASRGDLHSYVIRRDPKVNNGKSGLSELMTRFVIGEVVAALCSVHDLGFVFFDLKPENVLITEAGHIKLTDFGACRPITQEARDLVSSSRGLICSLRNGDWRTEAKASGLSENDARQSKEDHEGIAESKNSIETNEDDLRLEGTPGYLPPEALAPRLVGKLEYEVDSWSLGCVASFCLFGRPPFYGSREEVYDQITGQSKVHFSDDVDVPTISTTAQEFLTELMNMDASARLSVGNAAQHRFLTNGGGRNDIPLQPMRLHLSPPAVFLPALEASGTPMGEGDGEDPTWKRRQFSVLWAPLPSEMPAEGLRERQSSLQSQRIASLVRGLCQQSLKESNVERGSPFVREKSSESSSNSNSCNNSDDGRTPQPHQHRHSHHKSSRVDMSNLESLVEEE